MANPIPYGRDTYCRGTYTPGRLVRGVKLLEQRLLNRLTTPPGTLRGGEEEADFGYDLAGRIGSIDARDQGSILPVEVKNELQKDPAVDSVAVTAVRTEAAKEVSWDLAIHVESTDGDLDLLVRASEVSVQLIGVT